MAWQVAFNQDFVADLGGNVVGGFNFFLARQINGYPFALIAVLRFDDHRAFDFTGGGPSVFRVVNRTADRHRNAGRVEQRFGEQFVLSD